MSDDNEREQGMREPNPDTSMSRRMPGAHACLRIARRPGVALWSGSGGLPTMRVVVVCAFALVLAACTDSARVYPLDPAAMQAGTPKIEFERRGMGRGPVTVTMPDGEILHGEYQVTENAAVGIGFAGTQTATAIGYGSNRHVVISATGNPTIINCDGTADIGGHGSGVCQTSQGFKYRVMF